MSEWIDVDVQKPDAEKEVRLFCVTSSGYKYQCQGFYEPPGTCREDSDYVWDWSVCESYDEERDDYIVNPGWYEAIHNWDEFSAVGISDTVTHWMILPEPPEAQLEDTKPELRTCPICGSEAMYYCEQRSSGYGYGVMCKRTGCLGLIAAFRSAEEAAAEWNKRKNKED